MAITSQEMQGGFFIGEYRIEPRTGVIARGGSDVRVEPRVMDVLVCLAERAGEVVSRDVLNQQVWGNVVVTDQAVTNCISELRQLLGDDRAVNRVIETIPKRGYRLAAPVRLAQAVPASVAPARRYGWLAAIVLLGTVLSVFAWWRIKGSAPGLTSVAVLPFENAAGDASLDYLGLALPDEVATLLTQSRDLAVRPLGYIEGEDSLAAARDRHVDHLVSGRYYLEDDRQLGLAIEVQHVREERVIWRTRISAPAGDLVSIRARIARGMREGLLPALGKRAASMPGSTPVNDEAYQLYLRSLAIPQQPKQNPRAIEMLEKAVALEPTFAPAWHALGLRYYGSGTWWGGGEPVRQRSLAAHRRALELDPELIGAAQSIVTHHAETADLAGAYREARRLFDHFGPSSNTHFALSYVYRYAGQLEDSQRHCELARERDPQDPGLRTCAYAYLYAGELGRVMDFLLLDEGSYPVQWGMVLYHLRLDDPGAALRVTRQAAEEPTRGLMERCLQGARGRDLDAPVAEFLRQWGHTSDPEAPFALAPMLVYCGRPQDALNLLERAVDLGLCVYPSVELDPIWAPSRNDPGFQRIRAKGMACHKQFRELAGIIDKEPPPHPHP